MYLSLLVLIAIKCVNRCLISMVQDLSVIISGLSLPVGIM